MSGSPPPSRPSRLGREVQPSAKNRERPLAPSAASPPTPLQLEARLRKNSTPNFALPSLAAAVAATAPERMRQYSQVAQAPLGHRRSGSDCSVSSSSTEGGGGTPLGGGDDDGGFVQVCPSLTATAKKCSIEYDKRQEEMRRDLNEFFDQRKAAAASPSTGSGGLSFGQAPAILMGSPGLSDAAEGTGGGSDYGWQAPSSWAFMGPETYVMGAGMAPKGRDLGPSSAAASAAAYPAAQAVLPSSPSSAVDSVWALRVFKPVEPSDGVMSQLVGSSRYTYVTITCDLHSTAAELCQMLMKKFTSSRNLSRFRLHVVHRNTERLLEHDAMPAHILRSFLVTIGYCDTDQLNKIAREDHSYCCRFIFREYPPAPPRSEDFIQNASNAILNTRGDLKRKVALSKARITPKSAYLADVSLPVIPTLMFSHASTIEFLDLSRNTLLTLPDDLFEQLVRLRLLRLTGNLLTCIPSAILVCPSISHLDLSSNLLEGPALAPLSQMPNLTHLNISCNRIQDLPDSLGRLKRLRSLDVSSNLLGAIPACVSEMSELRELNASFNKITAISAEVVQLKDLRAFILVGNSIQCIDERVGKMTLLRQLDLRGNLLDSLEGLYGLSSLYTISLDYNNLTHIGNPTFPLLTTFSCLNNSLMSIEIKDSLVALKRLNLSCSRVISFPDNIFTFMPNIEDLHIEENSITKLPSSIGLLSNLTRLVASSNCLSEIVIPFGGLNKLSHLDLHTNNIKHITSDIWACPSLKVINVSSNFMTLFPPPPAQMHFSKVQGSGPPSQSSDQALPPLALSLEEFLAADNRLTDEIGDVIVLFKQLRVLNLSYNRLFDLNDSLRFMSMLVELYLSGNGLTAFPDEIEKCKRLAMLFVNGNKLSNLPGELAQNASLTVFDAQSNSLKYNISNWPYDWNWNYNPALKYLNLAYNSRLEIKANSGGFYQHSQLLDQKSLADFNGMHSLRLLDVTRVKISLDCIPKGAANLRARTSGDHQSGIKVAISEYCGRAIAFDQSEFIRRRFMDQEKDHLVGLFDGNGNDFVSAYLNDTLVDNLKIEFRRMTLGEEFSTAIRRAFLATNRDLSMQPVNMHHGSTACLIYLLEDQMIVANVGDTMAVLSRQGMAHVLSTKHHPWSRTEQGRIRDLGGFISLEGRVERELHVTRAFGYHHLLPYVNANPSVREISLTPTDEFVLLATQAFWKVISYQMAVDVARSLRDDPELAVQKLRDMAIARGVTDTMTIMFVDICSLASAREQALETSVLVERRRNAFRHQHFDDQVLSRLDAETAPPKPPCAFVFTDIKDSTKLWSIAPNAMRVAIKKHNDIMRRLMRIHSGYEVKTEGDAFIVAFQYSVNALRFSLAAQQQFLETQWPREILETPSGDEVYGSDGKLLFRGISVRIGIHFGVADDEEDKVARRMDYQGLDMIIARRVSDLADGGQINITNVVYNSIMDLAEVERPDVVIHDLGFSQLKGISQPEHLYVVYPRKLAERHRLTDGSRRESLPTSPLAVGQVMMASASGAGEALPFERDADGHGEEVTAATSLPPLGRLSIAEEDEQQ